MITILTNPKRDGHSRRKKHTVQKFKVPGYIVELLELMPFVTGFGIKGDVLAIEDTFSLMVGRDLRLCSFIDLGFSLPICWVGISNSEYACSP